MLEDIQNGGMLADSLFRHISLSASACSIVKSGHSAGTLGYSIGIARSLLEREDELAKKLLSAMLYPFIIGICTAALTIGLIRGIMPQIVPMLVGMHVPLPLLTRAVIAISDHMARFGIYYALGFVVSCIAVPMLYRRSKAFRSAIQTALIRAPIVSSLARDYSLAIFLRSCGSLISSGIAVESAYAQTVASVGLIPFRKRLERSIGDVSRGTSISEALAIRGLPVYVSALASAGQQSGTLGVSLVRAAEIVDRGLEAYLKRATALVEPIMMVGMGGIVGSIALSIMMPIYDVSRVLSH